jgi:uncharacterized protein involved in cysteine biosynthesis
MRRRGIRAMNPSGWEECDAQLLLSSAVYGELQTSSHPEGFVQVRVRVRPRRRVLAAGAAAAVGALVVTPLLAVVPVAVAASVAHGVVRARRLPAQALRKESE